VSRHQAHARLLRHIYLQKLSLSINQLSRSISSGDEVPIAKLMTKLLAGKPPPPSNLQGRRGILYDESEVCL